MSEESIVRIYNRVKGAIDASSIKNWAIGICVVTFVVGLIMIIWRSNEKGASDLAKRDDKVQQIANTYLKNKK